MMLFKNIRVLMDKSLNVRAYPTADRNAGLTRLATQAIPYLFSNTGYARPPLSVFIHVNNHCNLKCYFCDYGNGNSESMFYKNLAGGEQRNLPFDWFKTIVDKVKPYKPFVSMPAVEPLMYPHVVEAVEYVRAAGLRCALATNGTALKKKAEALVEAGLTKIVISIDGPLSVHDDVRGVTGTFRRIIDGILALDEAKKRKDVTEPSVYLNYVIGDVNYTTLVECVEQLPMDAIKQIDFRVMFFCTKSMAEKHNALWGDRYLATTTNIIDESSLDRVDTDVLWKQVEAVSRRYDGKCKFFFRHGREELATYYHEPEAFLDGARCVHAWYMMQVNTDGEVIPAQRCYHQTFGNIVMDDFKDVWNSPAYRQFRRDLRREGRFPACSRCEGVNF